MKHLNRSLIVGVVGAVIVAAAIALTYYFETQPQMSRVAEAPKTDAAATPDPDTAESKQPALQDKPASLAAPNISGQPVRPKFDVVRISPAGNAVIAGRAEPHAEVTITDREKEIGKVKADARGEWVLIPKKSLKAGSHELSLESRKPKLAAKPAAPSPTVLSKEKIVLVVPEKGKDIAGRKITGKSGALALSVPRDGAGGTIVLQKPTMAPEVSAPASRVVERSPQELAAGKSRIEQSVAKPVEQSVAKPVEHRIAKPVEKTVEKAVETKTASNKIRPAKTVANLSMDAIDYNETGKVEMSGRAPSGSRVQVYLDNKPLGAAEAGKTGAWRVKPDEKVPPGLYKMRVDQISKSGTVVARVELPFSRAKPLGKLPRGAVVFVQPGNSLWRIARNTYGQGLSYAVIYEANRDQIRNPHLIYPGQIFHLPKVN